MKKMPDCIIIGGGLAGLQAALQLGRYRHDILVIDSNNGRSNLCKSYHNILGWPDGVSGETLRKLGRQQAEKTGVQFVQDKVVEAQKNGNVFVLTGEDGAQYEAERILLATGVMDRFPDIPGLVPCLGASIYVCPDCDGYEVQNQKLIILGSGDAGANMALTLTYWTDQIIYINHEQKQIQQKLLDQLSIKKIAVISEPITEVLYEKNDAFTGVKLSDGRAITGEKGFIAFGGNEVRTDLAKQLGVERLENKHIIADARTKETNVPNVWTAGDVNAHSEQSTIAMGEGCQAAIWIHKSIMKSKTP